MGSFLALLNYRTWLSDKGKVREAVIVAIECGYRHIDCAYVYFNEDEVGEAIEDVIRRGIVKREDLFITTKLPANNMRAADVEEAAMKSLTDLKLDYVDLYLMHMPWGVEKDASFPPAEEKRLGYSHDRVVEVWREFERLRDAGRFRSIGVSNFSKEKLGRLLEDARIKPAMNQVELHPGLQQQELVDWCKERDIVVTGYSPLGNPTRPDLFKWEGDPEPLHHPVVKAIAEKHEATTGQVLLAWARQRGTVTIPKSVTPSRIVENFRSLRVTLSEDEMREINALDRHRRLLRFHIFAPPGVTWWQLVDDPEPTTADA